MISVSRGVVLESSSWAKLAGFLGSSALYICIF